MAKTIGTTVTLRTATEQDRDFLRKVYGSTRARELSVTGWSQEEKDKFLDFQFHAQATHYRKHYKAAEYFVIVKDGFDIGRLYVERHPLEIRIIDIALLPEYQQRGIGAGMLEDLLEEGRAKQLPVRIHVEHNNPAMRLYLRLGFKKIKESGVYHEMERRPDPVTTEV